MAAGAGGSGGTAEICEDVYPFDDGFTCEQQAGWGKCEEDWLIDYCDVSCGRCTPMGEGLRPKNFIEVDGTKFMDGAAQHAFVGANFWQGMNLAVDEDAERLGRELDRLKALGVTNVRVMASSEGPNTAPYRMVPALMTSPGVYDQTVFRGLDVLLDELSLRGMRAVMVLTNFWHWSGGVAQYVSWSEGGSAIPYPNDGHGWGDFEAYASKFYDCSSCIEQYRAHVLTVVERVNTVNGFTYRDDPAIFAWELANEPRGYPMSWVDETAAYIKSLDPNHLVTTGSEGENGGSDFHDSHASASIDYGTVHIWAENSGYYDPDVSGDSSLDAATTYALDYLREHEEVMRNLGKPTVLEEFGLARDGWTGSGKLDPAASTTHRDAYFQSLYSAVEEAMSQSQSLWGDNFWAWSGEARPPSAWVGDPPHEPAGWYSVYDTDTSTNAVIAAHAQKVGQYVP